MKLDMSFLIKDEELLDVYNKIQNRVSNLMKKEFDSELVHNKKYLRAKIKFYNNKTPIFEIMEYPRKIPASNINRFYFYDG